MLIKVDITPGQLDALHKALAAESNHHGHIETFPDGPRGHLTPSPARFRTPLVSLKDIKAIERGRGPAHDRAIPQYTVTLEAAEHFPNRNSRSVPVGTRSCEPLVPIENLQRILNAMDLYPAEPRQATIDVAENGSSR